MTALENDTAQKTYSLRWRLLQMISAPLLAGSFVVILLSAYAIYHEIGEIYDANLAQYARILLQVVDAGHANKGAARDKRDGHIVYYTYEKGEIFTVRQSAKSQDENAFPQGFSNQRIKGKPWRFFVMTGGDGRLRIEVGQKFALRHELFFQLMGSLWLPGVLFLALVFLTTWYGLTRGLRQMVDLSKQVDVRDATDLSPIASGAAPEEITPLLRALNRLLARMGESLRREREFTDNAAHELRTPLAAIKMQAQAIAKTQEGAPAGMANLLAGIERSARMVEQMLAFSRLQNAKIENETVELAPIVNDALSELASAAQGRGVSFQAEMAEDVAVAGDDYALYLMIKNVIDNAVKFSPHGGRVCLRLTQTQEGAVFEVQDEGSGIAPAHGQKVFERFYRIDKTQTTGSGIGLAIVKWVAEAHGARIETLNANPGLLFRISFKGARP